MIFWVKNVKITLEIFVFVLSIECRVTSNIISHEELGINNIMLFANANFDFKQLSSIMFEFLVKVFIVELYPR